MFLKTKKDSLYIVSFSLLVAIYLASLPVDIFIDRDNYLQYAEYIQYIVNARFSEGLSFFVSNEPMFSVVNLFLRQFFNASDTIRLIIAFSTFFTFYLVLKNVRKENIFLALMILFLPQVLKNNIIHLRQGLAVAIFLIGWFSKSNKKKIILFIVAAFTHSSLIIILSGLIVVHLAKTLKLPNFLKYIIYIASGVSVGLFGLKVAESLGARQGSSYQDSNFAGDLGMGFIFWSIIAVIYMSERKGFTKKHTSIIFFLLLYLGTYFFLPVTARVFESTLIIILLAATDLSKNRRLIFYTVYSLYFLITWIIRLPKPGFGWILID